MAFDWKTSPTGQRLIISASVAAMVVAGIPTAQAPAQIAANDFSVNATANNGEIAVTINNLPPDTTKVEYQLDSEAWEPFVAADVVNNNNTFDTDLSGFFVSASGGTSVTWEEPGRVRMISDGSLAGIYKANVPTELGELYVLLTDTNVAAGGGKLDINGTIGETQGLGPQHLFAEFVGTGNNENLWLKRKNSSTANDVTFDNFRFGKVARADGTYLIKYKTPGQQVSIKVRAVNANGAGVESISKLVTPAGGAAQSGPEIIYFGPTNTTGQAPYNTGDVALNGASSPTGFTATNGVIASTQTPQVGTYSLGDRTIVVDPERHAIANQADFDALSSSHYGKTIHVRAGGGIDWLQDAGAFGQDADMNYTVVKGDNGDPRLAYSSADNAKRHFDHIVLTKCRKLRLEGLFVNPATKQTCIELRGAYDPAGTTISDLTIEGCVIKGGDAQPFGDYSGGTSSFPGEGGIFAQLNMFLGPILIKDNVISGCDYSIRVPARGGAFTGIVGNRVELSYQDGIQIGKEGNTPLVIAGNHIERMLSLASDSGGPHPDVCQILLGATLISNLMFEANFFYAGDCRSFDGAQVWFMSDLSGPSVSGLMRGCGGFDSSARSISVVGAGGFKVDRCGGIPLDNLTLPYGGGQNAMIIYDATGNNVIENSFSGAIAASNWSTSVELKSWTAAQLTAALPAYPVSRSVSRTIQEIIALFDTTPGGALDGKGPGGLVFLADGEEKSNYTMADTDVPVPVLTNLSTPSGSTSFSATVRTNVELNPIYWAVVPAATTVTDVDDIRFHRITGALDYGVSTVFKDEGDGATDIALTGNAGTLSSGTSYKLVMFQDNGWSKQSNVFETPFTTS